MIIFSSEAFMLNNQKLNFLFDMKKLGEGGRVAREGTINFIKGVSRGGEAGCLFRNIAKFSVT